MSPITTNQAAQASQASQVELFWPLARQLAAEAALAYSQHTCTDARTEAAANIHIDPAGDIIVAFKGSSEPEDFLQDAKFGMSPVAWPDFDPQARAHTGFLEDFDAIQSLVLAQLRDCLKQRMSPANAPAIQSPWPGVFLTGHSLGGALAMLCALAMRREHLPVSAVYTFGQPRVGNKAFARLYDATDAGNGSTLRDITFRLVNQNDIVPRSPGLLLGYRHAGNEVFLPAGSKTEWQLNPGPWSLAWSDLLGLYDAWHYRKDILFSEHFLAAYRQRMVRLKAEG